MSDKGAELYTHVEALFPICRSITGEGLRRTLRYIADHVPLRIRGVPSGTRVLDWEVPSEWNIRDAAILTEGGRRLVDFRHHNLHVLQYSTPVDRMVTREELERHLYSIPKQPDLIPYRTSYYKPDWGFCVPDKLRSALDQPLYHVMIDAALEPGSLSFGECVLPGETENEVLFSIHCCHPSLANDNLSGIAVAIELARVLAASRRRFTYRFLFIPGTIGAIAWLALNREVTTRISHGLVLSCVGDSAPPSYKQSRRGDALIDRYMTALLREEGHADRVRPFIPYGYDERQYCSPGFNLPVGCFMRSPNGTFPEYHTSADNLEFVRPWALAHSLDLLLRAVRMIEHDVVWRSTAPFGEPQLGRRGLYPAVGGGLPHDVMTLLWMLNLADGEHSLLDMMERSGQTFDSLVSAAEALASAGLLERAS